MNELLQISIEQGIIFSILGMGLYISYRILKVVDLTVEGSYPLGAFLFARFATMGLPAGIGTLLAFLGGMLAGAITYTLHVKLKISSILSGILTMLLLYSINLRINGSSNVPLFNTDDIFSSMNPLVLLIIIIIGIKIIIDLFFKTEIGYCLRVTGDNETLVNSLAKNKNNYILLGLMLSNGLPALSGALMAQLQGFADIGMGGSIIVIALASIVIGETLCKDIKIIKWTTFVILGSIIYNLITGLAIQLGLAPTDLRAIKAIILILFIAYNNFSHKLIREKKEVISDVRSKKGI